MVLKKLKQWVDGYKTYITMAIAILAPIATKLGWLTLEDLAYLESVLVPLGITFARAGIKKAANGSK